MSDEPVQSSDEGGAGDEEPTMLEAFIEQVVTLVIAIGIALMVRQVLIEPFRIPSGSMFPTLLVGDHLFVNKISYGPRIPFTDFRLPGLRDPERGDRNHPVDQKHHEYTLNIRGQWARARREAAQDEVRGGGVMGRMCRPTALVRVMDVVIYG